MKKIKFWLPIIGIALLLSSCIVKSLHAFYTKDLIFYEPKLIGNWINTDGRSLKFEPFKDLYLRTKEEYPQEFIAIKKMDSAFNVRLFNKSYGVAYVRNQDTSWFQAMPFKIENQLFLDFSFFERGFGFFEDPEDLESMHRTKVHSIAKVDLTSKNSLSIKWLDEEVLYLLLDENMIKIKHERDDYGGKILLTASSEELVKFITKYMKSEDNDKWITDVEFELVRK